jgi:hypothetical protein
LATLEKSHCSASADFARIFAPPIGCVYNYDLCSAQQDCADFLAELKGEKTQ